MSKYTQEFEVLQIRTHTNPDNLPNAVKIIQWQITTTDGEFSVVGIGSTEFDTDSIENFVSIEELTADDFFNWVVNSFEDHEWESYVKNHDDMLTDKIAKGTLDVYLQKEGFVDYMFARDADLPSPI